MQINIKKVYGIYKDKSMGKKRLDKINNYDFISIAKEQGIVLSLNDFARYFNYNNTLLDNCYIKFLDEIMEI